MLRFLRRYNKGILVVGGVLLLVAWAISDTFGRLSQSAAMSGRVWAYVDGRDIRGEELMRLQGEMKVVELFGERAIPIPGAWRDPVHYFLLQKEAGEAGLVGPAADGFRSLEAQLAQQPDGPSVQEWLSNIAAVTGQSPEVILETVAKLNGIVRLINLFESTPRLSDRRLRLDASRLLASVDTELVILDARRLSEGLDWTPDEAALQAQLAEFGEVASGPGVQFGYRFPNRLKLEWITVTADSIRGALAGSPALGNIELRKHRDRNLALFPRSPDGSDDFESVREAVRDHRLRQLVADRSAEIAKFAADQLQMPLRGLPREGGFVQLPEDWSTRSVSFERLAGDIAAQFGLALPRWQTSGPLPITPGDIDRLPDIGQATSDRFGREPLRASQFLARLREFGGDDAFGIQTGVASPALRTPGGDIVIVRVTEADPSRAPRDVEEVRARLVADLKAREQFRRLVADADSLRSRAASDGLSAIAVEYGAAVVPAPGLREVDPNFLGMPFRIAPSIPGLGSAPETVSAIVDFALSLDVGSEPVASLPAAARIFAVPAEPRLSLVLGQVTGLTPLTVEEFGPMAASGAIERAVLTGESVDLRTRLFSRDAMIARTGFQLARDLEEAAEDAAAAEDDAPARAAAAG